MKLDSNFTFEKYGLKVRLVNENDASFIVNLRTDPKLGRYINPTPSDISQQIKWIREYKQREKEGTDYYFIYYFQDEPIGVNRIYNIHENYASAGSWVCRKGLVPAQVFATSIICREIFFEILNIEEYRFEVRKANKQVLRFHKLCGAKITEENELDYFLILTKMEFNNHKENLLKLLKLN